jgi:hypothetical protein
MEKEEANAISDKDMSKRYNKGISHSVSKSKDSKRKPTDHNGSASKKAKSSSNEFLRPK